jgi:hypothetical protein
MSGITRPDWGPPTSAPGARETPGTAISVPERHVPTMLPPKTSGRVEQRQVDVGKELRDLDIPEATVERWLNHPAGAPAVQAIVQEALKPLTQLDAEEAADFGELLEGLSDDAQDYGLAELEKGQPVVRPRPMSEAKLERLLSFEDGRALFGIWGGGLRGQGKFHALLARLDALRGHPEIRSLLKELTPQQSIALAIGLVGR